MTYINIFTQTFTTTTTFKTTFFSHPQLIGITDGYLSLLQDSGEVREDLKMPEGDLGKEIESKYEAGEEMLVNFLKHIDSTPIL